MSVRNETVDFLLPDTVSAGVEAFSYRAFPEPVLPAWDGVVGESQTDGSRDATHADWETQPEREKTSQTREEEDAAALQRRLAEECARSFEAGRSQGINEGRAAEHETMARARRTNAVEQAGCLLENFAREQARFFEAGEQEVVRLALAMTARILRREAQQDPLLLTGAVRVALGQIPSSAHVRLLVPAGELDLWTEAMTLLPNLPLRPVVTAGEQLQVGDCLIESDLGTADLGLSAQLAEMERAVMGGGCEESVAESSRLVEEAEAMDTQGPEREEDMEREEAGMSLEAQS